METESGSYIRFGRKVWICECCRKVITTSEQHFVRVTVDSNISLDSHGTQYYKKLYKRWHIDCALLINNLDSYEKQLLAPYLMAKHKAQEAQGGTIIPQNIAEVESNAD